MENIKLYQYLQLSESEMMYYANVFQFVKERNSIGKYIAQKLTSLPFGEVTNIKNLAKDADFTKVFMIVFGIPERRLMRIRVKEFFMALNWVKVELDQLITREKHLMGVEDYEMVEAGSERMNVFKEMNILIPLSKEYGMTPEQIASWNYSTVFTIMYYDKVSRDVEKAYNEIIKRKTTI